MAINKNAISGLTSRTRLGTGTVSSEKVTDTVSVTEEFSEIELSDVQYKSLDFFILLVENNEFDYLKSKQEGYWEQLKKDIKEAGILEALIAMPDGRLVSGYSRYKIASELGIKKVPVRLILSDLSFEEIQSRRRKQNLLRFEIDRATRLLLSAQIWPELLEQTADRVGAGSKSSAVSEVAGMLNKSERSIWRDVETLEKASTIAEEKNEDLKIEHINEAIKSKNEERRKKETVTDFSDDVNIDLGSDDFTPNFDATGSLNEMFRQNKKPTQKTPPKFVYSDDKIEGVLERFFSDSINQKKDYKKGVIDTITLLCKNKVIDQDFIMKIQMR